MKILSLFDGISCARVALERAGIKVDKYYASEIDKYAIQIAQKNYPNTIQLGDITKIRIGHYCGIRDPNIFIYGEGKDTQANNFDLIIGGSPCQDLSIAKKNRKGLKGCRSGLFYEMLRLIKEVKPKYFILENVNSMPKEAKAEITKELWGIEPIMINAALVSAQNRKRLFWVGKLVGDKYEKVEIPQPEDKGILLKDILENGDVALKNYGGENRIYSPEGKSVNLSVNGGGRGAKTGLYAIPVALRNRGEGKKPEYNGSEKANAMTTVQTDSMVAMIQTPRGNNKGGIKALDGKTPTLSKSSWEHNNKLVDGDIIRKLTPIECERLQSLEDNFSEGISNSQRYKALGNAFNAKVIEHILSFIK